MPHVVLLGDSIFDNAAYTRGGPDVIAQVREHAPEGWTATLLAVDGATTQGVPAQLRRLPDDATHLVVSAGGNDALAYVNVLYQPAGSVAEAMHTLAELAGEFERRYREMLDGVLRRGLPTAVGTIYNPRFPDPDEQRGAVAALSLFNDAILRAAFEAGVPVLDLRLICSDDRDYANPIEPSSHGGDKIARAILRLAAGHDFARRRTEVYL
ncbi:MAG TPA: SGNH/GDSL hydrolase family protein [Longimicrobium sp.]|nr:SGNH/GDSL hydrolase family protein [Longimicrobium sp.]